MVSRSAIALGRTNSIYASGIDDSEGNAKRVMLFGTAFLTTIDILVKENLFNSQGSDIRNVALVLGHFLNFAHDVEETCRANEDGWKTKVLDLADAHDIKPLMISSKRVVSEIRTSKANATPDEHDSAKRKTQIRREGLQNAAKSYESRHLAGFITVESLKAGVKRSWVHWNWPTEVISPRSIAHFCTRILLTGSIAQSVLRSPSRQSRAYWTYLWEEDRRQILRSDYESEPAADEALQTCRRGRRRRERVSPTAKTAMIHTLISHSGD